MGLYSHRSRLEVEKELYYLISKNKVLISCAVTAQLICAFVFTYAKFRFSHDAAHAMSSDLVKDKHC